MVALWPGRWRRVHVSDTAPGLGAREGLRPPREQGRRLGALLSVQASALGEQFVEGRDIGLGTGHQRVRIGRACRDRPAALAPAPRAPPPGGPAPPPPPPPLAPPPRPPQTPAPPPPPGGGGWVRV